MKKTILIFAAIVSAAVSCDFLDEKSWSKVDGSQYVTNSKQAESELFGLYRVLCDKAIYGQYLNMIFELPTDEAKIQGNSLVGARLEGSNAYNSSDSYVQAVWAALYEGVYRCNSFLETMDRNLPDFPENQIDEGKIQVAEAKCIRALLNFELVRRFGHVPLMTSTKESSQHPRTFKQADPVDVYKAVEKDLLDAIEALPYATDDNIRQSNNWRFSKGGALGLLAKVYATWAGYPIQDATKWQKAAETAGTLIESGKHSLLPDFDDLWKNSGASIWNPAESLIEVSFYAPKAQSGMNGCVGKFNGVVSEIDAVRARYNIGLTSVMPTFIQEWVTHAGDLRCDISYADYKYTKADYRTPIYSAKIDNVTTPITFRMACDETEYGWKPEWRRYYCYNLFPRKWDNEIYVPDENILVDNNLSNQNWYVLRYADVLLLYAEALNEVNNGPGFAAYKAVNQVRRRGYGLDVDTESATADLPAGLSCEEVRKAVRKERSYELAFEGQRRMDLIRWGVYYETLWDTYEKLGDFNEIAQSYLIAIEYTKKGKNELMPIPLREKDLCGFEQNPGWE